MTPTFPLDRTALHLLSTGTVESHPVTADFSFHDLCFGQGQVLSVFHYDATWGYRERHPDGDEIALVLDGEVEVLLSHDEEAETATRIPAGSGAVIPAGVWHRLRVEVASTILFITPQPAKTDHQHLS